MGDNEKYEDLKQEENDYIDYENKALEESFYGEYI